MATSFNSDPDADIERQIELELEKMGPIDAEMECFQGGSDTESLGGLEDDLEDAQTSFIEPAPIEITAENNVSITKDDSCWKKYYEKVQSEQSDLFRQIDATLNQLPTATLHELPNPPEMSVDAQVANEQESLQENSVLDDEIPEKENVSVNWDQSRLDAVNEIEQMKNQEMLIQNRLKLMSMNHYTTADESDHEEEEPGMKETESVDIDSVTQDSQRPQSSFSSAHSEYEENENLVFLQLHDYQSKISDIQRELGKINDAMALQKLVQSQLSYKLDKLNVRKSHLKGSIRNERQSALTMASQIRDTHKWLITAPKVFISHQKSVFNTLSRKIERCKNDKKMFEELLKRQVDSYAQRAEELANQVNEAKLEREQAQEEVKTCQLDVEADKLLIQHLQQKIDTKQTQIAAVKRKIEEKRIAHVTLIQALWRSKAAMKSYHIVLRTSIFIQQRYRFRMHQREIKKQNHDRQVKASIMIQKTWRGFRVRKRWRQARQNLSRNPSFDQSEPRATPPDAQLSDSDMCESTFDLKLSDFDDNISQYLSADSFVDLNVEENLDVPLSNFITAPIDSIANAMEKYETPISPKPNMKATTSPLPDMQAINAVKKNKELEALAKEWGCSLATAELMWKKKRQYQYMQRKANYRQSLKDPLQRLKAFRDVSTKSHVHSPSLSAIFPPIKDGNR